MTKIQNVFGYEIRNDTKLRNCFSYIRKFFVFRSSVLFRVSGLGFWVSRAVRGRGFTPLEIGRGRNHRQEKESTPERYSANTLYLLQIARPRSLTGFTIVEMLVVIAIAGMLLSGVLVLFQSSRAKSRDATREQNIKTLQNALALHANSRGRHPIAVTEVVLTGTDSVSTDLKNADAIPQVPFDPLNQGNYQYRYTSADGFTYTLRYYLETNTIQGKSAGENSAGP